MIRNVFIIVLLIAVVGALGTASLLVYQRKINTDNLDNLHMAEALMEAKDFDGAIQHLLPVVQRGKRFDQPDYALYLLAQAYTGAGHKEASDLWKRIADDFPESKYALDARMRQAENLLQSKPAQAREIYKRVIAKSQGLIQGRAMLGVASSLDNENNQESALEEYYNIISSVTDFTVISVAKDRLSQLNSERLWSPVLDEFCQLYTVKKGDAAVKIGQTFKTTAWFIEGANNVRANRLHPGQRLKVPKDPFQIIVSKERCRLELRNTGGKFIKWYPVCVGEQSYRTPAGEYSIINKEIEPTWYKPGGGVIQPNTPENALGTRWMGIGGSLGIHGTNAPETVGFAKSAGCIRMLNKDVEELYKLVTYGTRVTIIDGTEIKSSHESKNASPGSSEG